jgi:hypothetical protein
VGKLVPRDKTKEEGQILNVIIRTIVRGIFLI